MARTSQRSHRSRWGRVTIRKLQGVPSRDPRNRDELLAQKFQYSWWPAAEISGQLPERFRLAMVCLVDQAGRRRFVPSAGVPLFLREASAGGIAILDCTRTLTAQERSNYRLMHLIVQIAPSLREHFSRSFTRKSDLFIPKSERAGSTRPDILPERIGLDRNGHGERWTVSELLRQGREFATTADGEVPDVGRCIAAGLFLGAQGDPLEPKTLSESEARALVRMALFDAGPGAVRDEEVKRVVTERLLAALERHIDDDSDSFRRSFFEHTDNLVHQIAKQRRGDGPLPREIVRQLILDLVFDAFGYASQCIHLQMQAFLEALPEPLGPSERALFESIYFNQPHYGGLSLILLHDRFGFLKEAILNMLNEPGIMEPVGVLLRLLSFYEEMTSTRRQIDRAYKRRGAHRNAQGRRARTISLTDEPDEPSEEASSGASDAIADQLCKDRGIRCECTSESSWTWNVLGDKEGYSGVLISVECAECDHSEQLEIPRSEFKRIVKGLRKATGRRQRDSAG